MKKYEKNSINIIELFRDYYKENQNKLPETKLINIHNKNDSLIINISKQTEIIFKNKSQKINQKRITKEQFSILINSFNVNKNNINEISIIYQFKIKRNNEKLRIFGDKFIENNNKNCRLIINGKQKKIKAFINYNDMNNTNICKIKIKNINDIKNFSSMFEKLFIFIIIKKYFKMEYK